MVTVSDTFGHKDFSLVLIVVGFLSLGRVTSKTLESLRVVLLLTILLYLSGTFASVSSHGDLRFKEICGLDLSGVSIFDSVPLTEAF